MISVERTDELLELYDTMKKDIGDIERKYSLSYYKVEMDFPESLGIPKRKYVEPTEEELTATAEAQIAPKFVEKQRNLDKSYQKSVANYQKSLELLAEKHRQKLVELSEEFATELEKLLRKLTNNGLYRSSIREDAVQQAQNDGTTAENEQNLRYEAEKSAVEGALDATRQTYQESSESLQQQRLAAVAAQIVALKEKELNKKKEVEKYNASVDEKEAKYLASCERYRQYAQQAENERALTAARLYAELGESGVALQKKSQMLNYCKTAMWSLTKEEAQFILSLDSFLASNLGDYYSSLTDWVNTQLS